MEGAAELIDLRPYIAARRLREGSTKYTGEEAVALQRAASRITQRMGELRAPQRDGARGAQAGNGDASAPPPRANFKV